MEERIKIGYRYNVVDIHSHILPGVDDGAESISETMRLLHAAREQGIRDIIATPHYGIENGFAPKVDKIRFAFEKVRAAQKDESEGLNGLRLYLGEEVYCSDDAAERFKSGQALRINETRYAMVEFLEFGMNFESGTEILERLEKLTKSYAVKPILAHAERYRALQGDRDCLKKIQDLGVLIQVNAYDLALSENRQTRETAQWLAEERMISFIGSDMHGMPPKRPPKVREGIDWLYKHTNHEYADCVVRKNAEKLLRIRKYTPWEEDDYFMSPRMAAFFENRLHGRVVRCQVFPSKGGDNHNISRAAVELEDGRAYAIVDGIMGPRIFRMEAYADDSNSYFGCDETSWYWRWKGTDREVELKNLGGVEW